MDDSVECPFCDWKSESKEKPRSAVNRHLKEQARKQPHKRGKHPGLDSPRFSSTMKERRCFTMPKSVEERRARRVETQRRSKELVKRDRDDRIRQALCQLKSLPKPRDLSDDPCFAELVVYYLPKSEWFKGDTLNSKNGKLSGPGSGTSRFDRYHYRLLEKQHHCNKEQLCKAWEEWLRLGQYRKGEQQRNNLHLHFQTWGAARELYAEIQKGLYGTIMEQEQFNTEWITRAKAQNENHLAQIGEKWQTWFEIETITLWEECKDMDLKYIREPSLILFPGDGNPDDFLGRKIYE